MEWTGPILDNHMHLDLDRGLGEQVIREFANAGGTHLIIVNKPSWWYGVEVTDPVDFEIGFASTLETVTRASELLPGRAWAVLGVHPAIVSRLIDRGFTIEAAGKLMEAGIHRAAEHVASGEALAIKSGRPHYEVEDAVWETSNSVIRAAFRYAAEADCAVQLHTESGSAFADIAEWARNASLEPGRVVKHYATGPLPALTPSIISHREHIAEIAEQDEPFMMETDFLDDPDRPGAVLGTKTVPRRVTMLAEAGCQDSIERAHVDIPRMVYGIETRESLAN